MILTSLSCLILYRKNITTIRIMNNTTDVIKSFPPSTKGFNSKIQKVQCVSNQIRTDANGITTHRAKPLTL